MLPSASGDPRAALSCLARGERGRGGWREGMGSSVGVVVSLEGPWPSYPPPPNSPPSLPLIELPLKLGGDAQPGAAR